MASNPFDHLDDRTLDRMLDRAQKEPHVPGSESDRERRDRCRRIDAELQRRADDYCNDVARRNR